VNEDPETDRCAELLVIHEDYYQKHLDYVEHSSCGVDSGQLGIFDAASYRNDDYAAGITAPKVDYFLPGESLEGDAWYEKMCKFTLDNLGYGSYDSGIVSSSGWGDGMYPLDVARNDQGQIVAMQVIFIDTSYSDDDEPDTCMECGAEYEPDGSCTYCEHFEASKVED
jgi:hypothetical protein